MIFRQAPHGLVFGLDTFGAVNVQAFARSMILVRRVALTCRRTWRKPFKLDDGREIAVQHAYMGAETRYEDYVYLQLMEREWERMTRDSASQNRLPHAEQVSTGASLVLLFWTYFETRLEQLLRDGLRHIPSRFLEDALNRYSSVGARMRTFYKIAFDSTYHSDLVSLGYSDVSAHLARIHKQRNEFVHGSPQSIDDTLATSVVEMLKQEHEAWIAIYNHRVSKPPT